MENNINQIYEENLIYEPVKDNSNFEENNFFENLKEKVLNMDNIASNNIVNDFVNTLVEGITQSNNGDYSNERAVSNSVETSKVDTSRDTNDSSNLITSLNDNKGYEDNNLIYVDENVVIDKPLTRPTRTNTITRTTTRYVNPTNVNGNNNNSNNNYNNNYNNNSNNNNNSNTNRNNNNNQNQNVNTNRNISNRPNKGNLNRGNQNTANRNIPSQGATNQGAVNVNQGTSNRGITNQGTTNQNIPNQVINQGSNGSIPTTNQNQGLNTIPVVNGNEQMSNDNAIPDIVPNGSSYGYASTNNNISDDIQKVQDNATPENKNSNGGSNFTFVIVLVTIPILIILIIASVFFLKKYKKGKRGSNIVYPDDKIRKSNLFGTLQFWNSNKINRVSVSTGSRGSRTNLTSISNDREESNNSNVPEYSEWLEAGSNTLSMPPVSPPPLVTDGKVNGLTSSNFAMGVNINDNMNRNSSIGNSQINKPPMAKNAWKLEGMRIGRERESQRKSTRQSLFNSFQVW